MDSEYPEKKSKKDCVICGVSVVTNRQTCYNIKCQYLYASERAGYWVEKANMLRQQMNNSSSIQTSESGFGRSSSCRACGEQNVKNGCGGNCDAGTICHRCVCENAVCRSRILHQLKAMTNTQRMCFHEGCSMVLPYEVVTACRSEGVDTIVHNGVKYRRCKECADMGIPPIYCGTHGVTHYSHAVAWSRWLEPIDEKNKKKQKKKKKSNPRKRKKPTAPPPPPPPHPVVAGTGNDLVELPGPCPVPVPPLFDTGVGMMEPESLFDDLGLDLEDIFT